MREIIVDSDRVKVNIMYDTTPFQSVFKVFVNGLIVLDRADGSIDSSDVTRLLTALGVRYKIIDSKTR